jgi:hypothetical protein
MPTMPTREALRSEFDAAVQQIDQARSGSNLTSDFYARIGDSVFDAGIYLRSPPIGAQLKIVVPSSRCATTGYWATGTDARD